MELPNNAPTANVAELARQVECFTEGEYATLAGVKLSTVHAWRKRGQGPDYILLGCNYLYPRKAVSEHLQTLIRERSRAPIKDNSPNSTTPCRTCVKLYGSNTCWHPCGLHTSPHHGNLFPHAHHHTRP